MVGTPAPEKAAEPLAETQQAPAVGSSPHINFTPDNQPAPVAATSTPMDRLKAAIDTLNSSIGADIHDRLHAQGNAIKAIADVLFP